MLNLKNVTKTYATKSNSIIALSDVSLSFRKNEFVSILGPSGCGKTTLLNIIGGLDRYTEGTVVVNNRSTKDFKNSDWDTYRNKKIGFVFQSYNLIPQLSILSNVELALTISGFSKQERIDKSLEILRKVKLEEFAEQKPNQLSGGQMQRAAIARALINNPDIILADEPTGALDSESGEDVMGLLEEVAKQRLVIMVTHNNELAEKYSSRIIKLKDGKVVSDSNPYSIDEDSQVEVNLDLVKAEQIKEQASKKHIGMLTKIRLHAKAQRLERRARRKVSMKLNSAIRLSYRNLFAKKGRTFLTAFAGSIGIIGIGLVLAMSTGMDKYIMKTEESALAIYPLTIDESSTNVETLISMLEQGGIDREDFPVSDEVYIAKVLGNILQNLDKVTSINDMKGLKTYLDAEFDDELGYLKYNYGTELNMYCNYVDDPENYMKVNPFTERMEAVLPPELLGMVAPFMSMFSVWEELIDNQDLLDAQYELIGDSRWPVDAGEIIIKIDEKNQIDDYTLFCLGLKSADEVFDAIVGSDDFYDTTFDLDQLLGLEYKVLNNADYYYEDGNDWGLYPRDKRDIGFVEQNGVTVKVVGIVRSKPNVESTAIRGVVGYTSELTRLMISRAELNPAVVAQQNSEFNNIVTGENIKDDDELQAILLEMGIADLTAPKSIDIYANSFQQKNEIIALLNGYNEDDPVKYNDELGTMMSYVSTLTDAMTKVLGGFSGVSLIVSSIMIAIITYTSVIERRKEIGVLRSIGARKQDVGNLFLSESAIVGIISGLLGVAITYVAIVPTNIILYGMLGIEKLLYLAWWQPVLLFFISLCLSLFAGIVPAIVAAKKDPVVALRSN